MIAETSTAERLSEPTSDEPLPRVDRPPPTAPPVEQERADFERQFEESQVTAGWRELFFSSASLLLWFALFAGGTLIATQPFIDSVARTTNAFEAAGYSVIIILFWTITNVGILSMLAAVLGAFGQRTRFASPIAGRGLLGTPAQPSTDANPRELFTHYASAIMRGFGVYTLVLSGLLVLATDAIVAPTQGQYVRLAGMVSVISFYAGYDPEMLAGLLKRIERFLKTE
ncbi:MAG: hypothetical protein L0211_21675 [Planctomycetaceae bacterium]|nr:hypothetical protein [Planctomycetaceae bacterium]